MYYMKQMSVFICMHMFVGHWECYTVHYAAAIISGMIIDTWQNSKY